MTRSCAHCAHPIERGAHSRRTHCEVCRFSTRDRPRNAFLYWSGPSRFTGDRINVFIRHPKAPALNRKLGRVAAVVISPDAELPSESRRSGLDAAVCGTCPLRPINGGGCYVHMFPGPDSSAYAHRRDPVPTTTHIDRLYGGTVVRLAEWGDPAAVPLDVWAPLRATATVLAYTHAWRDLDSAAWGWCMASVSTPEAAAEAEAAGWRAYRVRPPGAPLRSGERQCPAAVEAPAHGRLTCEACRICTGIPARSTRSISLEAHGRSKRRVHRDG